MRKNVKFSIVKVNSIIESLYTIGNEYILIILSYVKQLEGDKKGRQAFPFNFKADGNTPHCTPLFKIQKKNYTAKLDIFLLFLYA